MCNENQSLLGMCHPPTPRPHENSCIISWPLSSSDSSFVWVYDAWNKMQTPRQTTNKPKKLSSSPNCSAVLDFIVYSLVKLFCSTPCDLANWSQPHIQMSQSEYTHDPSYKLYTSLKGILKISSLLSLLAHLHLCRMLVTTSVIGDQILTKSLVTGWHGGLM